MAWSHFFLATGDGDSVDVMGDSSSQRHVIRGCDSSVSRRRRWQEREVGPGYPKRGSEGLEHQATTGRGYQTEVVTGV